MFKPQEKFPHLELFKKYFPVNENTIFAWDGIVYTNFSLPDDLIVHEQTHHRQQEQYGLDNWLKQYLENPQFRLEMEIEAYKNQTACIRDRNLRFKLARECAKHLSSELYGNIISYRDALDLIK